MESALNNYFWTTVPDFLKPPAQLVRGWAELTLVAELALRRLDIAFSGGKLVERAVFCLPVKYPLTRAMAELAPETEFPLKLRYWSATIIHSFGELEFASKTTQAFLGVG